MIFLETVLSLLHSQLCPCSVSLDNILENKKNIALTFPLEVITCVSSITLVVLGPIEELKALFSFVCY